MENILVSVSDIIHVKTLLRICMLLFLSTTKKNGHSEKCFKSCRETWSTHFMFSKKSLYIKVFYTIKEMEFSSIYKQ